MVTAFLAAGNPAAHADALAPAQSGYLEGCGGCHGVAGRSLSVDVPDLAGEVGFFLCTAAGRDFILRLPNIAFAAMDTTRLASVMNFTVFRLGSGSVPHGARPFTADEVGAARQHPLDTTALIALRASVLRGILQRCPDAAGLLAYGAPSTPPSPTLAH